MPAVSFLVADPSPPVRTFIRQQLESYGFEASSIHTAATSGEALTLATTTKPEFLLTDAFARAALTGVGLYKEVLKHNPQCALALLGRSADAAAHQEADSAGAHFLLDKPFTADQFRAALATAMAQLAKIHPKIARQMQGQALVRPVAEAPVAAPAIVLPRLPQYKPGDQVQHNGRRETVKHVILRHGELFVHLHGDAGLVKANTVQRL